MRGGGGAKEGINTGVSGIRGGRGRYKKGEGEGRERSGGLETVIEVPEEEKKAEEKEEEEKKRREDSRRKGSVGGVGCGYEGGSITASWVDGGRWR